MARAAKKKSASTAKRGSGRAAKAAKKPAKKAVKKAAVRKTPAKKKPAAKSPAKKPVAKKAVKKAAGKKAPAKKATPKKAAKAAPKKKPVAKKPAAKKVAPKAPVKAPPPPPPKPKKKAKPEVTPAEIRKIKATLEEQKAVLLKEYDDLQEDAFNASQTESSGEASFDEEYADAGSYTFEREKELSIGQNIQDLADKVGRALTAIEDGTYGICENCGNPIAKARVLALPYSTLCLTCKQQEERTR